MTKKINAIAYKLISYSHYTDGNGDWSGETNTKIMYFNSKKEAILHENEEISYSMHVEPYSLSSFFNPLNLLWEGINKLTSELENKIILYLEKLHNVGNIISTINTHTYIISSLNIPSSFYWEKRKKFSSLCMKEWLISLFSQINQNDENFRELKKTYRRIFKIAKIKNLNVMHDNLFSELKNAEIFW